MVMMMTMMTMMMITMIMVSDDDSDHDDDEMTVSRLEDDTEEITIREGESLSLGCQVIAGRPTFINL